MKFKITNYLLIKMSFDDEYSHLDAKLFYIKENIPSSLIPGDPESERIHEEYNCQQLIHCKCEDNCASNKCACILNRKSNYKFNNVEKIATNRTLTKTKLMIECNSLCSCYQNCTNRLVQFGPRKKLNIKKCPTSKEHERSKGLGLFTEDFIPKGGFICEYAGEILTRQEVFQRNKFNVANNKMNYIISVNEFTDSKRIQTFIDPALFGNIGRYMNHSCEPNCFMVPVRIDCPIPKLCLFAVHDLTSGSELTFDYGDIGKGSAQFDDKETSSRCLCESKKCKKWIPNYEYT